MITITEIAANSTHLSGNPIKVKATTSEIPAGASDYMILLKVVSADGVLMGGTWIDGVFVEGVFIDAIAPAAAVVEHEISGWVDQAFDKDFTWPIPDQYSGKMHGYENQVYDIQLVPGHRYVDSSGNLQQSFQATWGTIFIVKGKLTEPVLAKLNSAGTNWFEKYCTGGRWLSYMPLVQKAGPHQPVKLWWKPPVDGAYTLKVKGYYSDNSEVLYTASYDLYVGVLFELDLYPAGLGLAPIGEGGKRLQYYEVWMEGVQAVEKRTFLVDWTPHEESWYLFVDNKMGGVECIWLNGRVRFEPAGERTISKRPQRSGDGVKVATRKVSARSTRKWIINTGHKHRDEMEALLMLLYSENMWLAIPPAGGSDDISQYELTPVAVVNGSLPLFDNFADTLDFNLELEEAH